MIANQIDIGAVAAMVAGKIVRIGAGELRRVRPNSMTTQMIVAAIIDSQMPDTMASKHLMGAERIARVRPNSTEAEKIVGAITEWKMKGTPMVMD